MTKRMPAKFCPVLSFVSIVRYKLTFYIMRVVSLSLLHSVVLSPLRRI